MTHKYVDKTAMNQIIGCVMNNPKLLDEDDKYIFSKEDFSDEIHQIIFGTIYNLHALGSKDISLAAIEDYLKQRPKKLATYTANKGAEFILKCSENAQPTSFNYYYNRLKKMTLFRGYNEIAGMDLTWLYDIDNIFDPKKKQEQEDFIDNKSLDELADIIDDKIMSVRSMYVDNASECGVQAGEGIDELLEDLKENPEIGYPLFGPYINTVVRGARLKKFYLRSAATGVGKTRSMIADACSIGCSQMYDVRENKWVAIGKAEPTLYIATEQELSEIQTMMVALLSGVNEEHIVTGEYLPGEWERVKKGAMLLKQGQIYFEALPDFSLKDIENTIKRNVRERKVKYVFNP